MFALGAWLTPAAAPGATPVYLRTYGTAPCNVTAATNTTPIRLTVSGACELTNGATVVVVDVRGNRAANIHVKNRADTVNFARKVANLNGKSFDLVDLNGQPVAGSGAYAGGGRVGLAAPYWLRSHPVLYFDGADGARTTSLLDRGQRANSSNPAYRAVVSGAKAFAEAYNQQWSYESRYSIPGSATLNAALHWKLDNNEAARQAALFGLRNPDQLIGTPACRPEVNDCGTAASSLSDCPLQFGKPLYQAYSLLHDQLSQDERARFIDFMLSDNPWTRAGIGYTDTALAKAQWKVYDKASSGTVSVARNSATVEGTGTRFQSQMVPGDIILMPHSTENAYASAYLVASIESDTRLRLSTPARQEIRGAHWQAGPRWNPSMYGYLWQQKHHRMTPLNGGASEVPSPYYGDLSGFYAGEDNNLTVTRANGMYALGLTTCADDPRGCLLASMAHEWFYDLAWPMALQLWTGFSQSGTVYHQARMTGPVLEWAFWTRNSFHDAPDPVAETILPERSVNWFVASVLPVIGGHLPNQNSGGLTQPTCDRLTAGMLTLADRPDSAPASVMRWFLDTQINYDSTNCPAYSSSSWAWEHYLLFNPSVAASPEPPTTLHFTQNNIGLCKSLYGEAICTQMPDVRSMSVSRTDWTRTSTYVAVNANGYACRDHCGDDIGGYLHIVKQGKALLSVDSDDLLGNRQHRGYVDIGGPGNLRTYPDKVALPVPWSGGNNEYMFTRLDLSSLYKPAARVAQLERQVLHLKTGPQDYVVDHVKARFNGAPQVVKGLQHFPLHGCGTPDAASCVELRPDSGTATVNHAGVSLSSRVLGVEGAVTVTTENGSPQNGAYAGGKGRTFRWQICPGAAGSGACTAAASTEWIVVHRASEDSPALPDAKLTSAGPFRVVEIAASGSAPAKVAVFTAFGETAQSLTLPETSHGGKAQYVIVGLAAGYYQVPRGDRIITEALSVAPGDHSLSFESERGEFTVTPVEGPLAIAAPAQLPPPVVGKAYRTAIAAVRGVQPYTWEVAAGALCAGLKLTAGADGKALVEGVAENTVPCRFTLRVSDAAGKAAKTNRPFSLFPRPRPGSAPAAPGTAGVTPAAVSRR